MDLLSYEGHLHFENILMPVESQEGNGPGFSKN
jgi:hypothetical protein